MVLSVLGGAEAVRAEAEPLWSLDVGSRVYSLGVSAGGKYVAVGSEEGLHLLIGGEVMWSHPTDAPVVSVAVTPDARYIAAGTNNTLYLLNRSGDVVWRYIVNATSVGVTSDAAYIAAGTKEGMVYLFRNREPFRYYQTDAPVYSVSITPDGSYVGAASGGVVYLLSIEGEPGLSIEVKSAQNHTPATSVALSRDATYSAAGSGMLWLFNASGELVWSIRLPGAASVSMDHAGRYLAAGASGGVYLFSGRELVWSYPTSTTPAVSIAPDGSYVGAASGSVVYLIPAELTAPPQPVPETEATTQPVPETEAPPPTPSPEPPGEEAALGVLRVLTTPSEAGVYVDGSYAGETPLTLVLEPGRHTLRVEKEGYSPRSLSVALAEGDTRTLNLALTPEPASPLEVPPALIGAAALLTLGGAVVLWRLAGRGGGGGERGQGRKEERRKKKRRRKRMRVACFDLEGPLSPQDNAYEVMGLIENGRKIFEVISRYDDLLTLEGRQGYEPGDTLKLIIPFLVLHGITSRDVERVSEGAQLVEGAAETLQELRDTGWKVHIISTSYAQHALRIARALGVPEEDVACTRVELESFSGAEGLELVREVEHLILEKLYPEMDDREILRTLDEFYFVKLPQTELGRMIERVEVTGGERKVRAMLRFLERHGSRLEECVAVGDSITDFKMLRRVREGGGLAIAFNANQYALPHCDVGVASTTLRSLLPLMHAFAAGGRAGALLAAERLESEEAVYTLSPGETQEKLQEALEVHMRFRRLVRGESAKLG